jgi:hypothetical protein
MQIVQSLHAAIALLMVGLIIGHIYIGTVGMEGAFSAMWSGWVDRNWAKEHHSLWYSGEDGEKRPAVVPIAGRSAKSSYDGSNWQLCHWHCGGDRNCRGNDRRPSRRRH